MRLVHGFEGLEKPLRASVVSVGNFDGVHLAHQQLLRGVVEHARQLGAVAAAVTFEPHPIKVLAPARAPKVLTPLPLKACLIEELGVDLLVVLNFTKQLAHLSPLEFIRLMTQGPLQAKAFHEGPNFTFGYRQAGNARVLEELGSQEGFAVRIVPAITVRGRQVSSTCIRELISQGKVHIACRLLGRPFSNHGPIVAGLGVGRRHTVPTLNLAPVEELLPQEGVYVTRTLAACESYDSVTNVGHKPTFGEHRVTVESYLLQFSGELQAEEMTVQYLFRLRDEIKFQNPAMLKLQIEEDARRSLKFFRLFRTLARSRQTVARG
jgi:riboflavin kinase/FMN adenylyltransferase